MAEQLGLRCRDLVELVTEYLDAVLRDRDRDLFEAHLAGCRDCRIHLDQMRQTISALGDLPSERLPESARDELLAAFRNWVSA
ncbi:MAG: anti-sigma factor family protein [Thermoleophilaceae bacterium]